jgi:hypothetical protein
MAPVLVFSMLALHMDWHAGLQALVVLAVWLAILKVWPALFSVACTASPLVDCISLGAALLAAATSRCVEGA